MTCPWCGREANTFTRMAWDPDNGVQVQTVFCGHCARAVEPTRPVDPVAPEGPVEPEDPVVSETLAIQTAPEVATVTGTVVAVASHPPGPWQRIWDWLR